MEYIKFINTKLNLFSSPLNINFEESFDLYLKHILELEQEKPIDILIQKIFISYSEKFRKEDNMNFIFYLTLITTILINLESSNRLVSENFQILKNKFLSLFKYENKSIIEIQGKLEKEMNTLYNHLFSQQEISILSVLIITCIIGKEDITVDSLFIKSIPNVELPNTNKYYLITIDYDKNLEKFLLDYNKLFLMKDELVDTLMLNTSDVFNKFVEYCKNMDIGIILTNKKVDDEIIYNLYKDNIFIIDKISLIDYNNLKNVLLLNELSSEFLIDSSIKYYNTHFKVEILNKEQKYMTLSLLKLDQPHICSSIAIRKYIGKVDSERKKVLRNIVEEYTNLIINKFDQNYEVDQSITYSDFYDNFNDPFLLEHIDKQIFYKFYSIKDELILEGINEVRGRVKIKKSLINEALDIINILINS